MKTYKLDNGNSYIKLIYKLRGFSNEDSAKQMSTVSEYV